MTKIPYQMLKELDYINYTDLIGVLLLKKEGKCDSITKES